MYFLWKDEYNTNIHHIDKQHQKMFEIGRNVSNLILSDNPPQSCDILYILQELEAYAKYHFKYEEKLMQAHNFHEKDLHILEHNLFVKKLERIKKGHSNEKESVLELIQFISDWVCEHILQSDMRYKGYIQDIL